MRPVCDERADRGGRAARLAFITALSAVIPNAASASAPLAPDQIEGLVTAGAVALAVALSLWASALVDVAQKRRRQLQKATGFIRAAIATRDALLGASRDPIAVYRAGESAALNYGGAED